MLKVLSYGGGVQTFAMLVMIEKGLIPRPDLIIHADTKAEYPETEIHIEEVAKPLCKKLSIPWITVVEGEGIIEGYKKNNSIPIAGFRSCTFNFKIKPIHKALREILGDKKINGVASVECWIGISTDESRREVKRENQSPKWVLQKYPLLELNYSRGQLIQIIEESHYEMPIKSGCFMCPYSGMKGFIKLKKQKPALFEIALEMENNYFKARPERNHGFIQGLKLKDINAMPSLFSFEDLDKIQNDQRECESGGCFL